MRFSDSARPFWFVVGLLSLVLGLVGAVLPLLPTTVFMLLAVYAFARSSPRLHAWLIEHPRFGPPIRNWQDHGSISRRSKATAMVAIAATPIVTLLLGVPGWVLFAQIAVLAAVSAFILTRPSRAASDS